jgi:anti-anti-sigma regulatory factor
MVRVVAGQVTVEMVGEIDLSHRPRLTALARRLGRYSGPVVVDLAGVTFGDATLARFLAETVARGTVTVRAPTRIMREFLALYDVQDAARVVA